MTFLESYRELLLAFCLKRGLDIEAQDTWSKDDLWELRSEYEALLIEYKRLPI